MFRSAKEIAYTGITVALLIGGQLALSAVGGVEIVTAIFVLYCAVFGVIRGVIVATAFSLVRCFIFGFFPQVILLYLIYYNVFAIAVGLVGYAVKDKKDLIKLLALTLVAVGFTASFTMLDNLLNIWLFNLPTVAIKIYIAQSIPVMISQTVCALITVPLFYYPLNAVFKTAEKSLAKK
ncbi:MAG: hypothetical protein IKA61_02570 [Clostridia bacterium]|nr:hypothetical protein [Clostridia bacterium]